jgi:hypothetical protein
MKKIQKDLILSIILLICFISTGKRLLNEAKRLAKIPGKEKETKKYKKSSSKLLGKKTVMEELPEYKVYPPGKYIFSLKAGEQTNHWIVFPADRDITYLTLSKDRKFKLVFDDGETVTVWNIRKLPDKKEPKFKIIAVTDQPEIVMTVK